MTETPRPDGPLTDQEWQELDASIYHLGGPDAWDEDRLEPALIPVTHYVPRLMDEVKQLRAQLTELRGKVEWGVRAEGRTGVFPARTEAIARERAELYSRFCEPGARSVPHHVVMRVAPEWREATRGNQP